MRRKHADLDVALNRKSTELIWASGPPKIRAITPTLLFADTTKASAYKLMTVMSLSMVKVSSRMSCSEPALKSFWLCPRRPPGGGGSGWMSKCCASGESLNRSRASGSMVIRAILGLHSAQVGFGRLGIISRADCSRAVAFPLYQRHSL